MGWTSPRTWVSGETLTAALLNVHLRDNMLGASAAVVAGTDITATGTTSYQRCGLVVVNVNITANAAISAGATIFTIASGHRPPITFFGDLLDTTGPAAIRVTIATTGVVTTETAISSGRIVRGQIVLPL